MSSDYDPYGRIETAAEKLARRVTWEQGNRIGLLSVHAIAGILGGAQQIMYGSAPNIETAFGTWVRIIFGTLALIGGCILFSGLNAHPRSIKREAAGLSLLAAWDALMTLGLLWARIDSHDFSLLGFNEKIPLGYVVTYPLAVYGGLFALIMVHLSTLHKFRKYHAPPAGDLK